MFENYSETKGGFVDNRIAEAVLQLVRAWKFLIDLSRRNKGWTFAALGALLLLGCAYYYFGVYGEMTFGRDGLQFDIEAHRMDFTTKKTFLGNYANEYQLMDCTIFVERLLPQAQEVQRIQLPLAKGCTGRKVETAGFGAMKIGFIGEAPFGPFPSVYATRNQIRLLKKWAALQPGSAWEKEQ